VNLPAEQTISRPTTVARASDGTKPLQISLEFVGGSSGPAYVIPRLSAELRAVGVESRLAGVLWPSRPQRPSNQFEKAFVPSRLVPRRAASSEMRRFIRDSLSDGSVNLLHCHSVWLTPPLYCAALARQYSRPLVISPHGTLLGWAFDSGSPIKRMVWPLFQRSRVDTADCFHATCEQEAIEIRQRGFSQPIAVIPLGVDSPDEDPSVNDREPSVLFLGRLHPKKGLDDLLTAWSGLAAARRDWRLDIAGPIDSTYARSLVERARREHIPRVSFLGEVQGDSKAKLLRSAGLFVLPTFSENFGVAVAEALAAGTPVAVSQGAPWAEVESHRCGWWHQIGLAGVIDALTSATALPLEELHAMGLAGRDLIARRYDWRVIANEMARVYRWLLNGGAKPESVM
jgi:glycosyltransferase involved in cell wall biosynthesis